MSTNNPKINDSEIFIRLFSPIGKDSFPDEEAIVVTDIESLTIQDSCIRLSSVVTIVVPFALGFLFHNDIAYKYIKIIQKEKTFGTQTALRERCIWWGKVNTIGMQSSIKDDTITIKGMSFADTYNHVEVDHQSYKNTTISTIVRLNGQIICKDAPHGSRTSIMSMSDIIFVPKGKDYNPKINSFARAIGDSVTDVLKSLLSKAGLYIFSTMHQGQPKIIINSLPIVPDGEYGFEKGASYLAEDKTLEYLCRLNEPARCNETNIISLYFTADYTEYRDRIRILTDNNQNHFSPNPFFKQKEVKTDRTTSGGIDLALAPFVPMVISRENISEAEAANISNLIWNSINLQAPTFHLELAGWELFGVEVEVGRIIKFYFEAGSPSIATTPKDKDQDDVFRINNEEMIITECVKKYSLKGFTASITLTQKDAFSNEKTKIKKQMFKEPKSSYFTGYEGAADNKT